MASKFEVLHTPFNASNPYTDKEIFSSPKRPDRIWGPLTLAFLSDFMVLLSSTP